MNLIGVCAVGTGPVTLTIVPAIRILLSTVLADALCDACLAEACDTTTSDMRTATEALLKSDGAFDRGWSCAICRRRVPTIFYRPAHRHERVAVRVFTDAAVPIPTLLSSVLNNVPSLMIMSACHGPLQELTVLVVDAHRDTVDVL
jgi:hypothetical protein